MDSVSYYTSKAEIIPGYGLLIHYDVHFGLQMNNNPGIMRTRYI